MNKLTGLKPEAVFGYFEEICGIPHGSGDMDKIADYCVDFAEKNGLEYKRDAVNNVIIYKNGTAGYEDHEPVILQGHTDMVCQKTPETVIDFEKDGLDIYIDGDYVRARGTTLGADNGIAVAMTMAVLASDDIPHPPIEAVFTTDEEIGMIGAGKLDVSLLKGKRMINLDSEEEDVLTVSCAGGSDFKAKLGISRENVFARKLSISISGLCGGHSGIEIHKGRVNANILAARLLCVLAETEDFEIISINGGSKANAIPRICEIELCTKDADSFQKAFDSYVKVLKAELSSREPEMEITCLAGAEGEYSVFAAESKAALMYYLGETCDGVQTMSCEIDGLVETSLNLGILSTLEDGVYIQHALRSNKASALDYLELKMRNFAKFSGFESEISGRYEPWEYKNGSELQGLYIDTYKECMGKEPVVAAMHAGLECAVFSGAINDLDCIAVGPDMQGVHTAEERLSISSTARFFDILCSLLSKM